MKCQNLLSGKKYFNMLSAENFTQCAKHLDDELPELQIGGRARQIIFISH